MTRITAEKARELAGPTIKEIVDAACAIIEVAAKKKKRRVNLTDNFWVHEGYSKTEDWKTAKTTLEKLGFTVEFYYEERQFVDMYTVVSW